MVSLSKNDQLKLWDGSFGEGTELVVSPYLYFMENIDNLSTRS